jgi:hypothetical protein
MDYTYDENPPGMGHPAMLTPIAAWHQAMETFTETIRPRHCAYNTTMIYTHAIQRGPTVLIVQPRVQDGREPPEPDVSDLVSVSSFPPTVLYNKNAAAGIFPRQRFGLDRYVD